MSGGQCRRIDIARALLHKPEILILDEPTTGLDPQTRRRIWEVIEKLRADENLTVFLTTHYMEEAANAGYAVILDKGSIVAEGTPFELKSTYVQDAVIYAVFILFGKIVWHMVDFGVSMKTAAEINRLIRNRKRNG